MLRPGDRVEVYLPNRSTTQALCCGTILMARITKMIAMASKTMEISMRSPLKVGGLRVCDGFYDESVVQNLRDTVITNLRRLVVRGLASPFATSVMNACAPVHVPVRNENGLTNIKLVGTIFWFITKLISS